MIIHVYLTTRQKWIGQEFSLICITDEAYHWPHLFEFPFQVEMHYVSFDTHIYTHINCSWVPNQQKHISAAWRNTSKHHNKPQNDTQLTQLSF